MRTLFLICGAIAGTSVALRYCARQRRLLHLLQIEHYEYARLWFWLRKRKEIVDIPDVILGDIVTVGLILLYSFGSDLCLLIGSIVLLGAVGFLLFHARRDWRLEEKKPLVFTGRAKRLLAVAAVPGVVMVLMALSPAVTPPPSSVSFALGSIYALVILHTAPLLLGLANLVLKPVQRSINRGFERNAERKLKQVDPLIFGVSGSYGKTTTKFCLGAVLGADRPTLFTPESYNSLLGVTRTINEFLEPQHEAFVVELGAYRVGDIKEICDLVHPKIGVLCSIGPVHLERFGSIDEILRAESEVLDSLPEDGHFVTNGDDEECLKAAARSHVPVSLFSLKDPSATAYAGEVSLSDGRAEFDMHLAGEVHRVSSPLLGSHNVANMLATAAAAHAAGMQPAAIAAALAHAEGPPHRLQPIYNRDAGVLVIDDAYNSNPKGAASALEVLRDHTAQRRILVTPGMVELGELEAELNREFGRHAADVCDIVILVGPRQTEPVRLGLADGNFPEANLIVAENIEEVTERLTKLTRAGDVVLFENDLPDTYDE